MPSLPFSVEVEPVRPGVAAVVVRGEVDVATAPEFAHALAGVIRRNDSLALIIDLAAVTFIDSSGLNGLVRAFEAQQRLGGAIGVVSDDSRLTALLEITRLDLIIQRYDSRADALRAFFGDD